MNDTLKAEPTDTFTAVDMATAAAQGFRDGQAAVEQAPAQDERGAKAWPALAGIGRDSGHPRAVVLYLRHEPSDEHLRMIQEAFRTRPAQTEQHPIYQIRPRENVRDWLDTNADGYRAAKAMASMEVRMLYAAPIAQPEQQPAYVECRECTDCGHVGINDAHPTDATCAMCDWSGPSPVEDQCPGCGKENAMGAACPKCSGRYRILAETHVAAPIAQTAPQPAPGESWIPWRGGECPLPPSTPVEYRMRRDARSVVRIDLAGKLDWEHHGGRIGKSDVVAYRAALSAQGDGDASA